MFMVLPWAHIYINPIEIIHTYNHFNVIFFIDLYYECFEREYICMFWVAPSS